MSARGELTMPELPEVETVRRGLAPVMEGARFVEVEARRPALAVAEGFFRATARADGRRAWAAGEISTGGPCLWRGAADASRHVRLVPRAGRRGRRAHTRPLSSRAVKTRGPRPRRVPHVERGA